MATFLPTLSLGDIAHAAQLIQQANSPQSHVLLEQQRVLNQQLFEVQKRPEAWGLVIPFLQSADPYVQFFGAHTAQVKIARDWDSFPHEHDLELRDLLLELMGAGVTSRKDGFIVTKLFVATAALALRLASLPSTEASHWDGWILACVQMLSSRGASNKYILEFLQIAVQEVNRADLLGPAKSRMRQTLLDVVPNVVQLITNVLQGVIAEETSQSSISTTAATQLGYAIQCMEFWLPILPSNDLTNLLTPLYTLLDCSVSSTAGGVQEIEDSIFCPVSEAFQNILSSPPYSNGAGSKVLTEPLLLWFAAFGDGILEQARNNGSGDGTPHAFCKLLVDVGDHSTQYIANNLTSTVMVEPAQYLAKARNFGSKQRGALVQTFLRLLLGYTSLPGYFGVDEEESDLTLPFWYIFQEALWSIEPGGDDDAGLTRAASTTSDGLSMHEQQQMDVAKAVYAECVRVLRRKVVWPNRETLKIWPKDAKDKFKMYRRDVGDALINAYYVLREDMMNYFLGEIAGHMTQVDTHGWEEVEATIHCVLSIQESIPVEKGAASTNAQFAVLFGPNILGRLPTTGHDRVRLTMLYVLCEYASWFTTLPAESTPLLLSAVSYAVSALREPQLCLAAANALRDLCDQNRVTLAPHIGAFADLHAGLSSIPDTERSKVLQSISSVIQALPPQESIPTVESLANPLLESLHATLQTPTLSVDDACAAVIQQLQTLTGIAKGLTRANDTLFVLDDDDNPAEDEQMRLARADPRIIRLRDLMLAAVRRVFETWSTDASVSDTMSDFVKAVTSLPSDVTIISLPAAPLLELVCAAAQRQLTAIWLSLASVLLVQLDPPPLFPKTITTPANEDARHVVSVVLPSLLETCLSYLGQPDAMQNNPDVVQAFFGGMEKVAQHFTPMLYKLPNGALDALVQSAVGALTLPERYSLVSACSFLSSLVTNTAKNGALAEQKETLARAYGWLVVNGLLAALAGSAPRSATQNLVELLSAFSLRYPAETRVWVSEVLFAPGFYPSKAGPDAKNRFVQALNGPRSTKKLREAAQDFSLSARGLEGTSFGYATAQA